MRRKHSEIKDPKEIKRILASSNIGRLATIGKDNYPYITPVNFVSIEENIYFHCAMKGEKLDNIQQNNHVCFEVDIPLSYLDLAYDPTRPTCRLHQLYHCVIIRGIASIVHNDDLKVAALNALIAKHEDTDDFTPVDKSMAPFKACFVVEIKPISITAKSDLIQKEPTEVRRTIADYFEKRSQSGDAETAKAMRLDLSGDPSSH